MGRTRRADRTWRFHVTRSDLLVEGIVEAKPVGELSPKQVANRVSAFVAEKASEGPTAPARHVYDAPYQGVKPVCEVASAAAFAKSVPSHSAALVTAVYNLGAKDSHTATSCARTNVVRGGALNTQDHHKIEVFLDLWDKPAAATHYNSTVCDPTTEHIVAPPIRIDTVLGTGKTCLSNGGDNWYFQFQVDEVTIGMLMGSPFDPTTPELRRTQLTPMAQAVAEALQD